MPTEEIRKRFGSCFKKSNPQQYFIFILIEKNIGKIYFSNQLGIHESECGDFYQC
jgi:hypothetical protein